MLNGDFVGLLSESFSYTLVNSFFYEDLSSHALDKHFLNLHLLCIYLFGCHIGLIHNYYENDITLTSYMCTIIGILFLHSRVYCNNKQISNPH